MNDDKIEAAVERIGDVLCDGDELKAENERLKKIARPSKPDAAKLALAIIEDWINRRGVTGIDRARKQLLAEALAEVFGAPEVKEAEGIS